MSVSKEIINLTSSRGALNNDKSAVRNALPHSLPLLNLNAGRSAVLNYFKNTWSLTEQLFSALVSDEAYFVRPYHKTRHPLIFYYAHPASLYVNKLLVSGMINKPVNKDFELLFETGVDEMNWDDLHEGEQDVWPELAAVRAYRQQVYELVIQLITTHPALDEPITQDSPTWAFAMAFEHERIHLETSSVLIRELPAEYVKQPDAWPALLSPLQKQTYQPEKGKDYPVNAMRELPATEVRLGKPRDWPSFGWDNEYGSDTREVAPFKASKFLISNGEFLQFVKEGGYENQAYWTSDGWAWRQFRNVKWPTFWVQDGPAGSHRYKLRSTIAEVPMQWSWPAIVNYYEAKAYCAWLTATQASDRPYRLLTEAEHHAIREPSLHDAVDWHAADNNCLALDAVMHDCQPSAANHNLNYGAEAAVNALPANSQGFYDTFGNVWQWCEDAFHPLPDFSIHDFYTDFSTPCFDGAHQMILGGSFISTGDEASIWSRFHFRAHFFQHAGFRIVQELGSAAKKGDKYDTDEVLDQYLLFHWGDEAQQRDPELAKRIEFPSVLNLIDRTADLVRQFVSDKDSVLDLGCAVGRASFELARDFNRVVGLDYSAAFVNAAEALRLNGHLDYQRWETGNYRTPMTAKIDKAIDVSRLQFVQGDAASLNEVEEVGEGGPFSAVLLSNLLCRLSSPQDCLRQFTQSDRYLLPGGILVIASPNTCMADYTPEEKFLDGAENADTLARLQECLPGFTLLHEEDLPFMIREHRRKYEYIISQVSVWRKGPAN